MGSKDTSFAFSSPPHHPHLHSQENFELRKVPDWQPWKCRVPVYLKAAASWTTAAWEHGGKVHWWEGTVRVRHLRSASWIKWGLLPLAKPLPSSTKEAWRGGGQESYNPPWSSTPRLNFAAWDATVSFQSEKASRAAHFCHVLAHNKHKHITCASQQDRWIRAKCHAAVARLLPAGLAGRSSPSPAALPRSLRCWHPMSVQNNHGKDGILFSFQQFAFQKGKTA